MAAPAAPGRQGIARADVALPARAALPGARPRRLAGVAQAERRHQRPGLLLALVVVAGDAAGVAAQARTWGDG
jgi:hypothetical protein